MAINDSSLSVDVFSTIRSVIVSASPKVTNSTTSGTKTASVYAQYNDKKPSTPQIIILPTEVSEDTFKFSSIEGKKFINVTVECYYSSTLGVDQLSDTIKAAIKTACDDGTITGMDVIAISEDYAFTDPNDQKFHLKTLVFTFDRE